MKYTGMAPGMWALFAHSFRKQLTEVFAYDPAAAKRITRKAHGEYRKIIAGIPEFEKGDRFKMNIVSCAMLTAFVLSMDTRPDVRRLTDYYRQAMMIPPMKLFCRLSAASKFTEKDVNGMRKTAAFRAADRNPYSWNMEFLPYSDDSGYEVRFSNCGICTLMKQYGLFDLVSAMCSLDYTMSEAGGASIFRRQHTLAAGGPYCDCGYVKKVK
ncbi:MAG: L-2-amino-thiazoline-4-carboxylic acid hydrolase [Erysipelotrichaceae bacterium]|nr:L-2-amino-thiazoline-4-carboxylic acid hydrolase [Erysipelotrichaceae bacterium]